MKKNVGGTDRMVRTVLGAVLLIVGFVYSSTLGVVLGAVMLFTAALSWCPLYSILGISTKNSGSRGDVGA